MMLWTVVHGECSNEGIYIKFLFLFLSWYRCISFLEQPFRTGVGLGRGLYTSAPLFSSTLSSSSWPTLLRSLSNSSSTSPKNSSIESQTKSRLSPAVIVTNVVTTPCEATTKVLSQQERLPNPLALRHWTRPINTLFSLCSKNQWDSSISVKLQFNFTLCNEAFTRIKNIKM